jgi:prepilin-type N-terminal cleavage/methylation domain-containing protein/prepilin-type processing-associated H-X9-DG protein
MHAIHSNSLQREKTPQRGFTLVELLVVIAIIGILIALLLPAIQAAREAGRLSTCSNNVRQMALACRSLEAELGYFPAAGWGWQWAGDPDRGYGASQPGGWHYNILPFMENKDLHDMGAGHDKATTMAMGLLRSATPVPTFLCPTRHGVKDFPREHPNTFVNIDDPMPRRIGRSDYAACQGDAMNSVDPGAPDTTEGAFDWSGTAGVLHSSVDPGTGAICRASELSVNMISDGLSRTYLLGERYLCPDCYETYDCCDNDQGWDMGYDWDTNRGTGEPPMRDQPGVSGCMSIFGSAHMGVFNMAMCDGSVFRISFEIDSTIHRQLGNRSDGGPTDDSWQD